MSGAFLAAWRLWLYPAYLMLMSLALFVLMGADKRRAQRERWRVREKTLFVLALLGGACGGWLGMRVFHHKTKHPGFVWGFSLLVLAQLVLCALLLWKGAPA